MKTVIVCIAILLSGSAFSQSIVSTTDFKMATGSWKGTLTNSDKHFTRPVNMALSIVDTEQVILTLDYPGDLKTNGNDTIVISKDGTEINGAKVTSRGIMEDGAVMIITEINGADGNDQRKATLRRIYVVGKNSFQDSKWVKFEEADAATRHWTKRNEYLFSR